MLGQGREYAICAHSRAFALGTAAARRFWRPGPPLAQIGDRSPPIRPCCSARPRRGRRRAARGDPAGAANEQSCSTSTSNMSTATSTTRPPGVDDRVKLRSYTQAGPAAADAATCRRRSSPGPATPSGSSSTTSCRRCRRPTMPAARARRAQHAALLQRHQPSRPRAVVNPSGNGDNVLLSINPGVSFEYEYAIPPEHPAGTFWYHTHRHGSTALQVSSGMAGALIIQRRPAADADRQRRPRHPARRRQEPEGAHPGFPADPIWLLRFEPGT